MKSKTTPFITSLLLLIPFLAIAQCPEGDIILTTQAEVDAFAATWPDCTEIDGNLTINQVFMTSSPVTDLTPLSALATINGILHVGRIFDDNGPTPLDGLENITSIQSLIIGDDAPGFAPMASLAPLAGITGELEQFLLHHIETTNLNNDFPGITSVHQLSIKHCIFLESVPTFANLTYVRNLEYRSLGIEELTLPPNLASVDFLEGENPNFFEPSGITISSNTLLHTVHSDAPFSSVYDFVIFDNPNLENITGFESLTDINLMLNLRGGLAGMFDAFHHLNFVSGTNLHFYNPMVPASIPELYIGIGDEQPELTIGGTGPFAHLQIWADSAEVVTFGASLTSINGDVLLSSTGTTEVQGLEDLMTIGGDLSIQMLQLTQIPEFSNLTSVNGDINLFTLPFITNFAGFSALTEINGSFKFGSSSGLMTTAALQSLNGLQNLTQVNQLHFVGLPQLSNMSALSQANFTELKIINLPVLNTSNLSFDVITADKIEISQISAISLPQFTSLTTINDELRISDNPNLTTSAGFSELTSAGSVIISNNPNLVDLICSAEISLTGSLTITGNSTLENCSNPCACALASTATTNTVSANSTGCMSPEEILTPCLLNSDSADPLDHISIWIDQFGQLHIRSDKSPLNGDLRIHDMTGRLIHAHNNTQPDYFMIPFPSHTSGIYLVSLITPQGQKTQKIFQNRTNL